MHQHGGHLDVCIQIVPQGLGLIGLEGAGGYGVDLSCLGRSRIRGGDSSRIGNDQGDVFYHGTAGQGLRHGAFLDHLSGNLLARIRQGHQELGAHLDGVGIDGQKGQPQLHGGIVVQGPKLRVLSYGIPCLQRQLLDITGFRRAPGAALKLAEGLLIVRLGFCQIVLCVTQVFLRVFDLPVHIRGVDAVEHLALFHLISLFKIRFDDLALHQGGDGIGVLWGKGAGGGQLAGHVSPHDGPDVLGIHLRLLGLCFCGFHPKEHHRSCCQKQDQQNHPFQVFLSPVAPLCLFIRLPGLGLSCRGHCSCLRLLRLLSCRLALGLFGRFPVPGLFSRFPVLGLFGRFLALRFDVLDLSGHIVSPSGIVFLPQVYSWLPSPVPPAPWEPVPPPVWPPAAPPVSSSLLPTTLVPEELPGALPPA